jgi:hypothetical protein
LREWVALNFPAQLELANGAGRTTEMRDLSARLRKTAKARKMVKARRSGKSGTPHAIKRTARVRDKSSEIERNRRLDGGLPGEADARPKPQSAGARFREAGGSDAYFTAQIRRGSGWGGARNDHVTTALSGKQVAGLRGAAARAIAAGRPLNRMVTVHWGALGIADGQARRATGRLVKLAADWCASKGVKMTWAWVRENDYGDGSKGSHLHLALHCPAGEPIGRMWQRWLRRISKRRYSRGAVHSRAIGRTLANYESNPDLYRDNLTAALQYMTKGVRPADAAALGIVRTEPAGKVIGKRAGWWQSRTLSNSALRGRS